MMALWSSWNQGKIALSNILDLFIHFTCFCVCGGGIVVVFMISLLSYFFLIYVLPMSLFDYMF
jgi:hypothetical protein